MSEKKYKTTGEVYTPNHIVRTVLEQAGYTVGSIRYKHIIDNSAGQGAFLIEIVRRYLNEVLDVDRSIVKGELETYIHGIEINPESVAILIDSLNYLVADYGLNEVNWDILSANTLTVNKFDGKMDFVVGNPPYVRVHNLQDSYDSVKVLQTAQEGMTDLYIVFYEIGLRMLNQTGTLSYIAPSSWFTSLAGRNLRTMIAETKHLVSVSDLGHYQPFPNITTYTAVVTINNSVTTDSVEYSRLNENGKYDLVTNSWEEFTYEGDWYFGDKHDIEIVKNVFSHVSLNNRLRVKNGFATLADKTFLNTDGLPTDALTIPAIKSTTGEIQRIIYPYTLNGDLLSESDIKDDPVYTRLLPHKDQLEKNKPWYGYGRTQALRDVSREKITLNSTIKDRKTLRLNDAPAGYGVYGGLYIVGFESPTEKAAILDALDSDEFIHFVSMLKKYRRGGYYTFSSKDAQRYLEYRLGL